MKTRLIVTALAATLIFSSSPLPAEENCSAKLEQTCTSCHYSSRICNKVNDKNRRAWENTMKRMVRYGLKIDSSEMAKITDCLVSLADQPGEFCKK